MIEHPFTDLLLVVVISFLAPLILGMAPRLRLPSAVLAAGAGAGTGYCTATDSA